MKVVILCGGQGTRLREETEFRPKPLVEIGQRPILWHIMKLYAHYGHRDFVLCLGYRGNMIKDYFLNYEAYNNDFTICLGTRKTTTYHDAHGEQDFRVTLADTGQETMTGGRVRRIERFIDEDTFLLTYGDGVANLDIGRLHRLPPGSRQAGHADDDPAAIAFRGRGSGCGRPGPQFAEKPQQDQWANIGYFVFNRRIFEYLGGDELHSGTRAAGTAGPGRAVDGLPARGVLFRDGHVSGLPGDQRYVECGGAAVGGVEIDPPGESQEAEI